MVDGWCLPILLKELAALYESLSSGVEAALPAPAAYKNYIHWLSLQDTQACENYWQHYLSGFSAPTLISDSVIQEQEADKPSIGETKLHLTQALTEKIYQGARDMNVTTSALFQSAWAMMLSRYCRSNDIVFGTTRSGRPESLHGVEDMVGLFINTLPTRVQFLDGAETSTDFVQRVHQSQLEHDQYAHVSLTDIQVNSDIEMDSSLFDSIMVFENYPFDTKNLSSEGSHQLDIRGLTAIEQTNFPLSIVIIPGDSVELKLLFDQAIFSDAIVAGMLDQLEHIVSSLIDLTTQDVRGIALSDQVNLSTQPDPKLASMTELFAQSVECHADKVAVVYGNQEMTYQELDQRSDNLAAYLSNRGVTEGDRVGLYLNRSIDLIVSTLAIIKAGCAYVPLDPEQGHARLAVIMEDCQAEAILTHGELAAVIQTQNERLIDLSDPTTMQEIESAVTDQDWCSDVNALAYIIYTSGSTGKPKGVAVEQGSITHLVHNNPYTKIDPTQIFGQASNHSFDAATYEIWGALLNGASLVYVPKETLLSPDKFQQHIDQTKINNMFVTTSLFNIMAEQKPMVFASFEHLLVGGEAISPPHTNKVILAGGKPRHLWNGYGPTENTTFSAWYDMQDISDVCPIGQPLPHADAFVMDPCLQPLPQGVIGELYLGGPGLARGYWRRPDLTDSSFIHLEACRRKLYKTGDLVYRNRQNQIVYVSRADNQIKLRGFRIELGEIASTINHIQGVTGCHVMVRNDHGDRKLVVYLVLDDKSRENTEHSIVDIQSQLKHQLAQYMLPSAIVVMDSLPLNANGKLDTKSLPEPQVYLDDERFEPLSNHAEVQLAKLWSDVLGHEISNRYASFFASGGHSLLAMQLVAKINQSYATDVNITLVFDNPILTDQAEAFQAMIGTNLAALPAITHNHDCNQPKLSFAQQRLWFIDQMEQGSSHYNMPMAIKLNGQLSIDSLHSAFVNVISRHHSLRTGFVNRSDSPQTRLHPVPESWVMPMFDVSQLDGADQLVEVSRLQGEEAVKPFDLSSDLMLRTCLIKTAQDEHILLLTMHHISSDGWSLGILFDELKAFYHGALQGRKQDYKDLGIQYLDYANWQHQPEVIRSLNEQVNYWKKHLSGAPAVHNLPLDYARPTEQKYQGQWYSTYLDESRSNAFIKLCRDNDTTLFMGLHSAFSVLLSRYSNETDILVGTPVANRNQAGLESLIGFLVNTLVLRLDLDDNPSFVELLERSKIINVQAYANQEAPFEQVVEALQPERDLSYHPLFQVMLSVNIEQTKLELSGLESETLPLVESHSQFDLMLVVNESEDTLELAWEYNTDLFKPETIERMAKQFELLIDSILHSPDTSVFGLSLVDQPALDLMAQWNKTESDYPKQECIHQLFEQQVVKTPDQVALVFEEELLTYKQLNQRANLLAHHLMDVGVGPENLVGICLNRSLEMVISILAVSKAGGAYVPLDPSYPAERLNYMLENSQASVLISSHSLQQSLELEADRLIFVDDSALWDELTQNSHREANPQIDELSPNNLVYVIYTSGSTGKPKGVMNQHSGLVNRLNWMQNTYQLTLEDKVLQKTPFGFDVSVWEYYWTLTTGATVVMARPEGHKDVDYLLEIIDKEQISVMHFVPPMLASFIADGRYANQTPSLRLVVCSGEALSVDVQNRFLANHHAQLDNLYGPTEAAIDVSVWRCLPDFTGRSVPIGKPIDNIKLHILDQQLNPAPVGVVGELFIAGVGVARGYYNRDDLTQERFIANPHAESENDARLYRTGDLARWLREGDIEYLGRIDHQVKIRGFRIELGEIETAIGQQPEVEQCVVVVKESRLGDQFLAAYLVITNENKDSDAVIADIKQWVSGQLPEHMLPAAWMMLDVMPLTPNGKVDRKALPEPQMVLEQEYVAPETATEIKLANVWQKVLHSEEQVGKTANFFTSGGHSLLAIKLLAEIRADFNVALNVRSIFTHPVLCQLAILIDSSEKDDVNTCIRPLQRPERIPLSYAQQRLWFLEQLEEHKDTYNMPLALHLNGDVDVKALHAAFNDLIVRHESLRTCMVNLQGVVEQRILDLPVNAPITVVDLSHLDSEHQAKHVSAIRSEEASLPFDLSKDLMVRARLLKLTQQAEQSGSVLLLTLHHIAGDGASLDVLLRDLSALYQSHVSGEKLILGPLPIQYADYALWQLDFLQDQRLNTELTYWQKRLENIPDVHSLPLDKPRPNAQTYQGALYKQDLPNEVTASFRAYLQNQQSSLFMGMQAAFSLLLSRYSGEADIILGTPVANREQKEVESLIGFFVNTLVLRTEIDNGQSFNELLSECRNNALDSFAHQQLPFERLVETLQPNRDLSHHPLFQIMLVVDTVEPEPRTLGGLAITPLEAETTTSKFDLTLNVEESVDIYGRAQIELGWEYSTDLFEAQTIERLSENFIQLVSEIVSKSEQSLESLSLVSQAEHQRILDKGKAKKTWPVTQCLFQDIEQQVEKSPQASALVFNGTVMSYADMNAKANQLAHYLIEQGVGPDTLVGMCLSRSAEMIITILAIHKSGGAYVPLDVSYPVERLTYMMEDSQCKLVISETEHKDKLLGGQIPIVLLDTSLAQEMLSGYEGENPRISQTKVIPSHMAYVIYTSGSTGKPKGVMIEHQALSSHIKSICIEYGVTANDNVLQFSNIGFDASVEQVFEALVTGASLYIRPEMLWTSAEFVEWLRDNPITITEFPPLYAKALLEPVLDDEQFWSQTSLSRLVVSGDVLNADFARSWQTGPAQKVCQLINNYGPTETTISSTLHWLGDEDISTSVPIGFAIMDTDIYVVDEQMKLVPEGVPGELLIGGMTVARGYLNREELTAGKFIADPFSPNHGARVYRTGDKVRWLANGELEFFGRFDTQIKLRGFRIELGEIETALREDERVLDAAVIVRDDKYGYKHLVAYLVAPTQDESLLIGELQNALRETLPSFMIPSSWSVLESMPVNANGKLDRKALPEPTYQAKVEYVAPSTSTEIQLVEIWKNILGISSTISADANFFSLGGHSLLAVRLIAKISAHLGRELTVKQVFLAPTLSEMATVIDSSATSTHRLIPQADRDKALPLSFAQQRMWFMQQLEGGHTYNMAGVYSLEGSINPDLVAKAFQFLLERHEALRTCFRKDKEVLSQCILPLPVHFELPVTDLSLQHKDEQQGKLHAITTKESEQVFDLENDLMIRAQLVKLSDLKWKLLITQHHIASDGWSSELLIQEFATIYDALFCQRDSQLAPLTIQYADHAVWQQDQLQGEQLETQINYWSHHLQGLPDVHSLPLDRARPNEQSYAGNLYHHPITKDISDKFKQLCQTNGASLFMGMQAVFSLLLSRYSGEIDIIIGTPVANREQLELQNVMGLFVNSLVIRTDLSGNPSFEQLIERCKETALSAYEHQSLPFERIVEVLKPNRDMGYHPLFQVMLNVDTQGLKSSIEFGEIKLTEDQTENDTSKFDISLNILPNEENGLDCFWEYSTDLFNSDTIRRMALQLECLMESILLSPDRNVFGLSLADQDTIDLINEWNDTDSPYPSDKCIHQMFEQQVINTPNHIALVFEGDPLTYEQLNKQANLLAHHLIESGVGPEKLVGIFLNRSLEMVISILAVNKAGGAYVPLDPTYPLERLNFMLENSDVEVLITSESLQKTLVLDANTLILVDDREFWSQLSQHSCWVNNPYVDKLTSHNLAYVIYTSGSTGKPKGVMNQHSGLVNRLNWMQNTYQLTSGDNVLQKTPFGFDVSVWEYYWTLMSGATVVIARPEGHKDIDYLLDVIKQEQITVMHFVPPMLASVVADGRYANQTPSLRLVVCSGEALPVDVQNRFLANHHAQLDNLYGPTEAAIDVSMWHCQQNFAGRSVPIGKPIDNIQLHILDSYLNPVPVGAVGELFIAGVGVARGYYNRDDLTRERFIDNPYSRSDMDKCLYCTGDLARWLPEGNIEYLGRIDQQVKIRGFRMELGEIETTIGQRPYVDQCIVVVQRSGRGDKFLAAYVIPSEAGHSSDKLTEKIKQDISSYLPEHMIPSAWVILDSMPLTPNGKVDRKALPEPTISVSASKHQAPEGNIEQNLCQLWSQVLNIDVSTIGRDSNFFEVGGHSLLAIELINKIQKTFGTTLPLTSLFRAPTLRELALQCTNQPESNINETKQILPIKERPELIPLSYAQQRLWFIDQMEGDSSQYYMPATLALMGAVDIQALQGAFVSVIAKHEVLRTTYHNDDRGVAYQFVHAADSLFDMPLHDLSNLENDEQTLVLNQRKNEFMTEAFDLSRDVMLRAALYKLGDNDFQLIVIMHHIASDGWSSNIFISELSQAYNQLSKGEALCLSPLDIQYADYAIWQREWLQGDNLTSQLDYWRQQHKDIPEVHSLPLDKPRPAKQCYTGDVVVEHLDMAELQSFLDLCSSTNASLFMGLNALFSMLLSRYSGEQDIVVGTPIANRDQSELAQTIGFFVNNLVLRNHVDMSQSFQQLLEQSRDTALAAYEHQNVSFEHLVEELKPARDLSHHPIFQVMLVLQNTPEDAFTFDGLQTCSVEMQTSTTSFDLTLSVEQQSDGLSMHWEFNTSLFEKPTITRMAKHFVGLLRDVVTSPQVMMSKVLGFEHSDVESLLGLGYEPLLPPHLEVKGLCIHELFERQVEASPEAIALIFEDRQVTYQELNFRSNQLAHHLIEQGVGPDQIVGICCQRSIELIEVMLGILKAGGAFVPLDPTYPEERLAYMVEDSQLSLIIGEQGFENKLPTSVQFVELKSLMQGSTVQSTDNITAEGIGLSANNLAYVIYTSGSTGKPKGVMLQHDGLVDLAISEQQRFMVSESSRVLQFASFSFDGAVADWVGVLNAGGTLVLINQEQVHSAELLTEVVIQHQVNYTILPPALLPALDAQKWQGVKHLILAGDACPLPLAQKWAQGRHLMNGYGPRSQQFVPQ